MVDRTEHLFPDLCLYVNVQPHNFHRVCNSVPLWFQDYKTYLDFVLALENRKEPAALQYIFKLLDIENQGHLNVFSLNYFFRVSAAFTDTHTHRVLCIYHWKDNPLVNVHTMRMTCSSGHSRADETPRTGTCFLSGCQGTHTHTQIVFP